MSIAIAPHTVRAPFTPPTEAKLLGWIVAWSSRGINLTRADLAAALQTAGFDPKLARALLPRHAWSRACHELNANRIIRLLNETDDDLTFQFTAEHRAERFEYREEAEVKVDKTSGRVSCDNVVIREDTQRLLDTAIDRRTGSDVTALIQRLFKAQADLFPIKQEGGVYFVPKRFEEFVNTVRVFAASVNIEYHMFPIAEGTPIGGASVQAVIADGLTALIEEYDKAVDGFSVETRKSTVSRAVDKVAQLQLKIDSYAGYLEDQRAELLTKVQESKRKLRSIVEALGLEGAA